MYKVLLMLQRSKIVVSLILTFYDQDSAAGIMPALIERLDAVLDQKRGGGEIISEYAWNLSMRSSRLHGFGGKFMPRNNLDFLNQHTRSADVLSGALRDLKEHEMSQKWHYEPFTDLSMVQEAVFVMSDFDQQTRFSWVKLHIPGPDLSESLQKGFSFKACSLTNMAYEEDMPLLGFLPAAPTAPLMKVA